MEDGVVAAALLSNEAGAGAREDAVTAVKESDVVEDKEVGTGKVEQKKTDAVFKTSLCSYFRKLGSCRHGLQCRYAHGDDELRPRPDGTWDPTSLKGRSTQKPESQLPLKKKGQEEEEDKQNEEGDDDGVGPERSCIPSLHKCIQDLPLKWSSEDLSKLLADKGLTFRSSRKRKRSNIGFVEFESDEHAMSAKEKLDGLLLNSKVLKIVDAAPPSWEKNRAAVSGDQEKMIGLANNKSTDICDVVTPLARLPYDQQLEKKRAEICQLKELRNFHKLPRYLRY
ncbi:hypothetical protein L7F22_013702 [Adiantum nelumboides]|nr:hypothetical protein [Adiantum nelumboides]